MVITLDEYCGLGYDATLIQTLQALFVQFQQLQGQSLANLTQIYCN